MAFILRDTEQTTLSYTAADARGNAATVQNPTWESSDPSVVTVTASADGSTAVAAAAGPLGTATVTLTGDADLGDGVSPIVGTLDLEVVASNAAVFNITASPPTASA
jgi:hypothetical protein